eukprot:COSAG02_NODE_39120_length_420_cov_23.327103_1_plen_51_part_10
MWPVERRLNRSSADQVLSGTSVGIGSAWGFRPIPANTSNFTTLSFEVSVHS